MEHGMKLDEACESSIRFGGRSSLGATAQRRKTGIFSSNRSPPDRARRQTTPAGSETGEKKEFGDVGTRLVRSSFAGTRADKPRACGKM
jgi:hypothetical protein